MSLTWLYEKEADFGCKDFSGGTTVSIVINKHIMILGREKTEEEERLILILNY